MSASASVCICSVCVSYDFWTQVCFGSDCAGTLLVMNPNAVKIEGDNFFFRLKPERLLLSHSHSQLARPNRPQTKHLHLLRVHHQLAIHRKRFSIRCSLRKKKTSQTHTHPHTLTSNQCHPHTQTRINNQLCNQNHSPLKPTSSLCSLQFLWRRSLASRSQSQRLWRRLWANSNKKYTWGAIY